MGSKLQHVCTVQHKAAQVLKWIVAIILCEDVVVTVAGPRPSFTLSSKLRARRSAMKKLKRQPKNLQSACCLVVSILLPRTSIREKASLILSKQASCTLDAALESCGHGNPPAIMHVGVIKPAVFWHVTSREVVHVISAHPGFCMTAEEPYRVYK